VSQNEVYTCPVAVKGQIFDDSFPSYWLNLLLSKKQNQLSKLKMLPLLFLMVQWHMLISWGKTQT